MVSHNEKTVDCENCSLIEKMNNEINEIKKLSTIDFLTGIYNKRYFEERFYGEIKRASRSKEVLSLLMIDVDNFKQVNDAKGHLFGDELLKCIAQNILSSIRGCDVFARFGGDEFVIIAPNTGREGAKTLANKVKESILICFTCQQNSISLSIGIAYLDFKLSNAAPSEAREQLIINADLALYKAKGHGKNYICLYDE